MNQGGGALGNSAPPFSINNLKNLFVSGSVLQKIQFLVTHFSVSGGEMFFQMCFENTAAEIKHPLPYDEGRG